MIDSRPLVRRKPATANVHVYGRGIKFRIAADNKRLHFFAPFRTWHADHGAFSNAGVGQENVLDARRHDVDAARNDHIVAAPFQIEITVGIKTAEVARTPPAPVAVNHEGGGGGFGG